MPSTGEDHVGGTRAKSGHRRAYATDNGIQVTGRACDTYAFHHIVDRIRDGNGIEHRLTRVKHAWTNGHPAPTNAGAEHLERPRGQDILNRVGPVVESRFKTPFHGRWRRDSAGDMMAIKTDKSAHRSMFSDIAMRHSKAALASGLVCFLSACGGGDGGGTAATSPVVSGVTPAPTPTGDVETAIGCQSRSSLYPWGRADLRTWTPRASVEPDVPAQAPGTAFGAPMAARLVQAYGDDFGGALRTVILETADGCRRQFRAGSFVDADRAVIDAAMTQHPLAPDDASYRLAYRAGLTSPELVQQGRLSVLQTQHFAIWYGNDSSGAFYRSIAQQGRSMDQVLQDTGEWLEKIWLINRRVLNSPMPYADDADRRKIDVDLCGTGRPVPTGDDLGECGASASASMGLSAWAVYKGTPVLSHEFGHVIQFYSGGLRRDTTGPIWETGAQWNSFAISPTFDPSAADYLNQLENGFLFSPARYGAWAFMTYLFEKDSTRTLVFDTWRRDLRNPDGSSQEDYLQAFVRLAQTAGIYPKGFESFADDAGWYGARLVTMDFLNQRAMLDALRPTRTTTWVAHLYTPLVATDRDGSTFTPPGERALLQWGTHLVPLTVSGNQVKVTLTGGTTANQAAWRFTIVAVGADGKATYAPMAAVVGRSSATATLSPAAGARLYLAVTATPYAYESPGWQVTGQPKRGTQFPYTVRFEGATPRTGSVEACDPTAQPGATTLNYTLAGNSDGGKACQ